MSFLVSRYSSTYQGAIKMLNRSDSRFSHPERNNRTHGSKQL